MHLVNQRGLLANNDKDSFSIGIISQSEAKKYLVETSF